MPEPRPTGMPARSELAGRFQEIAQLLREADHLEPAAQQQLAELVEELGKNFAAETASADELAHLAESTAHLAHALHQRPSAGLLGAARQRLEQAIIRIETKLPAAAETARRLLDAVANLGI